MNSKNSLFSILIGLLFSWGAQAMTFDIPSNGDNVVGHITYAHTRSGETLADVGRRFDVGVYEMIEANPTLSPDAQLSSGTQLLIPSQFVLPPGEHKGIVINLAELRLYYFPNGGKEVITEPVGIGREGWDTPLGLTKVTKKVANPEWRPTERVREDAAEQGYILPEVWPPGPDNPLGGYMMRLGWPTYLIHGTNRPEGVGRRSSAGCIRMFPEDIEMLFSKVDVGTPVRIINRPVKIGWLGSHFYLEAHKPIKEKGAFVTADKTSLVERIHEVSQAQGMIIRWSSAKAEMSRQSGIPIEIGRVPDLVAHAG